MTGMTPSASTVAAASPSMPKMTKAFTWRWTWSDSLYAISGVSRRDRLAPSCAGVDALAELQEAEEERAEDHLRAHRHQGSSKDRRAHLVQRPHIRQNPLHQNHRVDGEADREDHG